MITSWSGSSRRSSEDFLNKLFDLRGLRNIMSSLALQKLTSSLPGVPGKGREMSEVRSSHRGKEMASQRGLVPRELSLQNR